jgi:type IV secretion system protein VirB8
MKKMSTRLLSSFSAYRSYQYLTRILLMAVIALSLGNIGLTGMFLVMFPLKEIQPMFLNVTDKANQVVKVEPIEKSVKGFDLLQEKLARHYVMLRETFDLSTEEQRYQELEKFSSSELWNAFWPLVNPDSADSHLKKRQEKRITRSVIIHSCSSLAPEAPNTYQVEWESIDQQDTQETSRGSWISTLTVELQPSETSYADQYINPIGFKVIRYSIQMAGENK